MKRLFLSEKGGLYRVYEPVLVYSQEVGKASFPLSERELTRNVRNVQEGQTPRV